MRRGRGIGLVAGVLVVLVAIVAVRHVWRGSEEPTHDTTPAGGPPSSPPPRAPGAASGPAAPGRRIAGLVVDGAGAPITGATVRLASAEARAAHPTPPVVTDARGAFDLGTHAAAPYLVSAQAARRAPALASIDLRDPGARPSDELRLVLHACDASLHGTVRDAAGGTIGGARVAVAEKGLPGAEAVADAEGRYELCVPVGRSELVIEADGYAAILEHAVATGRTPRDFVLAPGTSVTGLVVRDGDRAPIEGAVVELRAVDRRDPRPALAARSDRDGRFVLDGVAPGRHALSAHAARLVTAEDVEVVAEIGLAAEVTIELAAAVAVRARAVDRATRAPVPGLALGLRAQRTRRVLGAISQPDGSAVFEHVLPGEHALFASGALRTPPVALTVGTSDVDEVVLEVDAGSRASVSGRVLRGGTPVEGAIVRVPSTVLSTISDHAGRYTLRGLEAGEHALYAESQRLGAFTRDRAVVVAAGEAKTGLDLELDLAGSIAGTVVDQHGAPVAGAALAFTLVQREDGGIATTADDGGFVVRGLSGGGDYLVEVRPHERSSLVYAPAVGKRHPRIAVRDGTTHVTGLRLAVRVDRLAIAGRVVDSTGAPVADARVRAVSGEYWQLPPATTSDASGAFVLEGLSRGTYRLVATSPRGEVELDGVAGGRRDVVLRLAPRGAIEGELVGFPSPPTPTARSVGRWQAAPRATVTGTRFVFRDVPPGEYRIVARAGALTGDARVTVAPGETQQLTLRARANGAIIATVRDATTRAPLAGLECLTIALDGDAAQELLPGATDRQGVYRFPDAPPGRYQVACQGPQVLAHAKLDVRDGETVRLELVARPRDDTSDDLPSSRGHAGLTLGEKLGELVVEAVEPGGPAARAGVLVGDVIATIDGERIRDPADALLILEVRPNGPPAKLEVERGEETRTLELAPDPP